MPSCSVNDFYLHSLGFCHSCFLHSFCVFTMFLLLYFGSIAFTSPTHLIGQACALRVTQHYPGKSPPLKSAWHINRVVSLRRPTTVTVTVSCLKLTLLSFINCLSQLLGFFLFKDKHFFQFSRAFRTNGY